MIYQFYPDVLWITNFVMDFLVLFLVRLLKKSRSSFFRIFLSSAFGATGTVIFFVILSDFVLYQFIIHMIWNPVMIIIAFLPANIRIFFKEFFMTYIMMALLGGIIHWGFITLGGGKYFWLWGLTGFGICMLVIHGIETEKLKKLSYDVLLQTGEQTLVVKGFLDTGNLLLDPFINQPVHIIQENVLQEVFQKNPPPIRYIPFHSLGQEHGLLPVITLKAMYIINAKEEEGTSIYMEKPVFGLAKENLFQTKEYQIILNARTMSV